MSREKFVKRRKMLGERIKTARNKVGLSQENLAKRLGIAYQTLNKYEKGHRSPDSELLRRMAIELNCDPGWLLSGEGSMERQGKEVLDYKAAHEKLKERLQNTATPKDRWSMAIEGQPDASKITLAQLISYLKGDYSPTKEQLRELCKRAGFTEPDFLNTITATISPHEPSIKDPRLTSLIERMEYIYREGDFDKKIRLRGFVEELYDEVVGFKKG